MADLGDTESSPLDPAASLSPDDPLRAWADQNLDWRTGRLLTQDPQKAIDNMISRGIPPPEVHADGSKALPYTDPMGAETGGVDPSYPIRTTPDGKISGNITAPVVNPPRAAPAAPALVSSASPLDPEPEVPLPQPRPEAAPGSTDVSGKKKPAAADALGDFSKSLSGIKAPTAPPLNAVGTPSVRSPTAISAPNLANLIALTQGQAPQTLAQTLGKLLVAGKA